VPDFADVDISQEDLDRDTRTVVVLDGRDRVNEESLMSFLTTLLVICIILSGIVLLTKDLSFLSQSLLKPLRALAEEMQSIVQLQLAGLASEQPSAEKGTAEIRQIQKIFENMKKAIKSWGKYVPWPVVTLLLRAGVDAKPCVKETEVTCFFSDIAGFTTIVESIPPESSLLLLSRYFNDMSKVIDDHCGIVIEFIGDAILAVYGAPQRNDDHPNLAVKSTLRMLTALTRINQWSVTKGLPEVQIRCGVHTGEVLIGNMGFHSRIKYGVVGPNASIPSRLEELNKNYGTNFLISEATYSRLDLDTFIIRPIDYYYVRHLEVPEAELVYQVLARQRKGAKAHKLTLVAKMHADALESYRTRHFGAAAVLFEQVNTTMRELTGVECDKAALVLMKRCKFYSQRSPHIGWDGVWDQATEAS